MLKNTFIKVLSTDHGTKVANAFIKLDAKNSKDVFSGVVGHYLGVITDTLTCIPAKDFLSLKGTKKITTIEELESVYNEAVKIEKQEVFPRQVMAHLFGKWVEVKLCGFDGEHYIVKQQGGLCRVNKHKVKDFTPITIEEAERLLNKGDKHYKIKS